MTTHLLHVRQVVWRQWLSGLRLRRPLIGALLGGVAVVLLVVAICMPSPQRQRWIAPYSSDQLQAQPARPDVLNVDTPPTP